MIPPATIDAIRQSISLPALVREYGVVLSPSGFARCCFHREHTASLKVHTNGAYRGTWKCFGCGAGGSAIDFVMRIENWSFSRAARYLAERAGISLGDQPHQPRVSRAVDAEDREMSVWYWKSRWEAVRQCLDAAFAEEDDDFCEVCGRLLRTIEQMPEEEKFQEFQNAVTREDRIEWRAWKAACARQKELSKGLTVLDWIRDNLKRSTADPDLDPAAFIQRFGSARYIAALKRAPLVPELDEPWLGFKP